MLTAFSPGKMGLFNKKRTFNIEVSKNWDWPHLESARKLCANSLQG